MVRIKPILALVGIAILASACSTGSASEQQTLDHLAPVASQSEAWNHSLATEAAAGDDNSGLAVDQPLSGGTGDLASEPDEGRAAAGKGPGDQGADATGDVVAKICKGKSGTFACP